ncbi:hypothetical protein [Bacillus sp. V2I10]|uniref:hypothetical protein n=1 Tax=Bacillus sp. V2I10 TaxID=3042276 RepID=UPI002785CFF0|nr:hypothetical protein [Bacillus sp. V2I10]MDQ0858401.1 hypothetical protein [Bacillus sp. V2I10]
MTEIQFFLEGIGNRNVATDYSSPNYISGEIRLRKHQRNSLKKTNLNILIMKS